MLGFNVTLSSGTYIALVLSMNFDNTVATSDFQIIENSATTSKTTFSPSGKKSKVSVHSKGRKPYISSSENPSLQRYFNEVGQEYTFNSKQEIVYAVKLRSFEAYYKQINAKINSIKKTLCNELQSQKSQHINKTNELQRLNTISLVTKNSIQHFKSQFASSNLKLVISLAKNFSNRGLPYSDLIQEGNIGLLKAIDRFDPHKGYKFSTYESWWIQQSMNRAVLDQSRLIRLPVKIQEEFFKISKSPKSLTKDNGTAPRTEDISVHLGINDKKVKKVEKAASLSVISLDTPKYKANSESGNTIQDFIPDNTDCVETYISQIEMSVNISKALSKLSEREQNIISMRFGIGYKHNYTLDEIGNSYDLTRERIRQIERNALIKIKNNPDGDILREYLT